LRFAAGTATVISTKKAKIPQRKFAKPHGTGSGQVMRAEIERLVEEIKQSIGLLRRHL